MNVSPKLNTTKYAKSPPTMNSPAEQRTNGTAQRRSFRYKPGAMKAHTWYNTQGDARKMAHRIGSLTLMMLNASIAEIWTRFGGLYPRVFSATTAGCAMIFHSGLQ